MMERRESEYGIRGLLWVFKNLGGPDVAVVAKTKINRWGVYRVNPSPAGKMDLKLQQENYTFMAACESADKLLGERR